MNLTKTQYCGLILNHLFKFYIMEEQRELEEMRDMFAGIALPGVIGRAGMFYNYRDIAIEAYSIAEAMIRERACRLAEPNTEKQNESNS